MPIIYLTQLLGLAFGLSEPSLACSAAFSRPSPVPAAQEGGKAAHA